MLLKRKLLDEEPLRVVRSRPARTVARCDAGQKTRASLMTLPAELRVSIYEYVLVASDTITVDATLKQPALLSTSRQIKHEALDIWYYQNSFEFFVADCDAALVRKFESHLLMLGLDFDQLSPTFEIKGTSPRKSWKNLMLWCENVCRAPTWFPADHPDPEDEYVAFVAAACGIANQYYVIGASWEMCQISLGLLRRAVGAHDPDWLVDE